jgi:hypothetical protein
LESAWVLISIWAMFKHRGENAQKA